MSYFQQNLELLRRSSEPLAVQMENLHEQQGEPTQLKGYALEPSRQGWPTVRYTEEGQSFFIHSPYDPEKEAQQFADRIMSEGGDGNFSIFFGLGLGYGVQEVLKRLPKKDRALIYEPHFDLLYLAFCHCDLSTILTRDFTTLTTNPSLHGTMLSYMNLFELAQLSGVKLISNTAFERLPSADKFNELADRIRYEMMAVGGNIQTLMVMGEMQQMNIILNLPHVFDNPPFQHLIDAFKGKPAIVVSAGPSLEKNMHLLNEAQDRALIVAVDTAVRPLIAQGIRPHVVVSGDPQELNYRHLRKLDLPETYLIVEPQCPIGTLNDWTGPKFICTFHDNMMQWVDRVLGNRGRVMVWGSVAVMAYDVCVKVGANPIVFIGQDLSFPGGRTYTPGTVFEVEDSQEMTVDALKKQGSSLIEMTDIYGETVQTNRQMYTYYNFLKNRFAAPEVRDRQLINATEGGILVAPQVKVLTLRETIDQYMQQRFDVNAVLAEAHAAGNPINYTNLLIELDNLISSLRDSLEQTQRGIEAVERTLEAIQADDDSESARQTMIEHYNRVVSIRKRVVRSPEVNKILEMANQAGIFSFAQGIKHTFPSEDGYTPEQMKRGCYHYHTLYFSTRDAVERLIPLVESVRDAARVRQERQRTPVVAG